jgi:hypothetical protein
MIKVKPKKPKAPNQNPDCKKCGKPFKRYKTTKSICDECIFKAIDYGKENPQKVSQTAIKQAKSAFKKEVIRDTAWYLKKLQDEVNLIARLIDKDCVCISSLRPMASEEIHGGHRWNTADYKAIRFNLFNIHSQSLSDNHFKSGNADGYVKGLNIMYGKEYADMVQDLPNQYNEIKHMRTDLEQFYRAAQGVTKFLKLENKTYTPSERIELRGKLNKMIGIFD